MGVLLRRSSGRCGTFLASNPMGAGAGVNCGGFGPTLEVLEQGSKFLNRVRRRARRQAGKATRGSRDGAIASVPTIHATACHQAARVH